MEKGYFWCFHGDREEIASIYSDSRCCDGVEPYLKEFEGVLLTEDYPGYDSLCSKYPKITHTECCKHSRRYFVKSEKATPEATKEALKQIGALYKIEDDIRRQGLEDDALRDYRQQKAKPLVDQFFECNRKQLRRLDLVPGNPLSKALGYVHKREKELQIT